VSFAAAGAAATPQPALFLVSVSGTAHAEWDHTGAPAPSGDCTRALRSQGVRDVRFHSTGRALTRFVAGRLSRVTVRSLTGTITLSGANTATDVCSGETREATGDCAPTKRIFRGGSVTLVPADRAGSFRPTSVHVSVRAATCPAEPVEVVHAPLGPIRADALHVPPATLANGRNRSITVTATASGTVTYGKLEHGTLRHRSVWKIVFTRASRVGTRG
jgi:hypothetical protein